MSWKDSVAKGVSSFQANQLQDALSHFNQAISFGCDQFIVYDSRAAVLERLDKPKEALLDAKKAIDIAPDRWQGYFRAARLFFKAHKYDSALTMVDHSIERVEADDAKRRGEIGSLKEKIIEERDAVAKEQKALAAINACHIGNMPVEILSEIFLLTVGIQSSKTVPLSHVCKHWRAVALGETSLWQTIIVTDKTSLEKARTFVYRARGRVRNLGILVRLINREKVLHAIANVWWGGVKSFTFFPNVSPLIHASHPHRAMPNLKALEVHPEPGGVRDPYFLDVTSKIRKLTVYHLELRWYQLLGGRFQNLETIINYGASMTPQFYQVVETNPSLTTLILTFYDPRYNVRWMDPNDTPPPIASFTHGKLTYIDIAGLEDIQSVVKHITSPSLQTFMLSAIPQSLESTLDMLSERKYPLRVLRLHKCLLKSTSLIKLLKETSSLQELELSGIDGQANAVLEALASDTALCPTLTDVNLSHCPDVQTGPLLRLVNSRLETAKPIASLVVDGCPKIEAGMISILASKFKVGKFSCMYMTKSEASWKR